jgi:hypothetical protein
MSSSSAASRRRRPPPPRAPGNDELTGSSFTLKFVPVEIAQGAGGAPDAIAVLYGSGNLVPTAPSFSQNMPSPSAVYKVSNRYGFREGDLVIAAEAAKDCTLSEASNLPATVEETPSPPTIKLWPDSATVPTTFGPVLTLTPDERHYRYEVFTTVVPVRNLVWEP